MKLKSNKIYILDGGELELEQKQNKTKREVNKFKLKNYIY